MYTLYMIIEHLITQNLTIQRQKIFFFNSRQFNFTQLKFRKVQILTIENIFADLNYDISNYDNSILGSIIP